MTRNVARVAFGLLLMSALSTGCKGTVDYYDKAADKYAELRAIAASQPEFGTKRVCYAVTAGTYLRDQLVPQSSTSDNMELLLRVEETIMDMRIFKRENVGQEIDKPDYFFTYNVNVRSTDESGMFSGMIWPYYQSREYLVRLKVLDANGQIVANYVAMAETSQTRHIFLFWAVPFYWPSWAEARAQDSIFRALAAKLIKDREKFR